MGKYMRLFWIVAILLLPALAFALPEEQQWYSVLLDGRKIGISSVRGRSAMA